MTGVGAIGGLLYLIVAVDGGQPDSAAPPPAPADAGAGPTEPKTPADTPASAPPRATRPPSALNGVVLSRGTRDPVLGATIYLDGQAVAETDEKGRFALEVPPGSHRVQFQAPGFEPETVPLVRRGAGQELTVRLDPRLTGERYETVVTAPRDGEGVSLDREGLTTTAGSLGEPFRVIESLPGVSQVTWPLPLYAVRGANPGNTGFFIDGIRLPALFHLVLGPAVIHPHFLEKLDFYPGGYPAQFGRYVSGVVSATTADPKPDRVRGSMDVRLFDAGGIVSTPIREGQGTVTLAGRYSYTGLLFSLISPEYTLGYWDYQARFDHRLGPGTFTAFAFGSHDVLGHKEFPDTYAEIDFHRVTARWRGAVGPGRLEAGLALGVDNSRVSLNPVIRLPIEMHNRSLAPRVRYLLPTPFVDLEVGADAELQQLRPKSTRLDAEAQVLFQDRMAFATGAYTALHLRLAESLLVTPSLRADSFFQGDEVITELGPRLSMRYKPLRWLTLNAQMGRYAQAASLPVPVPGVESFGLDSLGIQTSKQGSLGAEFAWADVLSLETTGFYQRFLLTDLLSIFNYDLQDPRLLELREGEGYGVEVLLRRPPQHKFHGWISYTLSWSERLVGPSRARAYSDWDQRHVMNLVGSYRFPRGYSLGARFHVNTGRPYPIFDDDNPRPPDYTRLPTFYQLDVRADKRFIFDKYVLDLYLEVVNTTLSEQVFDIRFTQGVLDRRVYKIALPSVGVHAEW